MSDVYERSPNQTPEEHAAEIVDCWQRVGLLVEGHRNLTEYQQSLAEDIRVAEKRGELRANAAANKSAPSLSPTPARGASPQESLPESNNQSETP